MNLKLFFLSKIREYKGENMAGYVIHLAVAEEYLKNTKKTEDYNDFIKGVLAPDEVKDKSLTHYGSSSGETHLDRFLKEVNLDNSFNRGYFLHLVTDYIFYNKIFDTYSKDIYNDYDILNAILIEKYKVKIPKQIENSIFYKKGELKILNLEKVEECIKLASSMELDNIKREILDPKFSDKWLKIRKLKML